MTIYLDVIFIENLFMNYIILFTTGFIVYGFAHHIRFYNLRLIFSSFIGAIYATLSYIKIFRFCYTFSIKIAVSFLMCMVAFNFNVKFNVSSLKSFFKMIILFYLTSFVAGGISLSLLYLFNKHNLYTSNYTIFGIYPVKISIISGFIGFSIIQISFALNKKYLKNKDLLCELQINILNKSFSVNAFVDSGNTLKDPYFHNDVIVIDKEIVEKSLNMKCDFNSLSSSCLCPRLIPFHSVGCENDFLIGIKPSSVIVSNFNKRQIILHNVMLGIHNGVINNNCSALIGLNLLQGGNNFEYLNCHKKNL